MNKMLVSIFDNEMAAQSGLRALRKLHEAGDITLYSTGVLLKDADGKVLVKKSMDQGGVGAGVGLAVGGLIGLLGGPVGVALGAVTGTVAGAIRDFWMAGVGRDFIEETERFLTPGKVALVAEIEEEWVIPVDAALEAVGAQVFRRSRTGWSRSSSTTTSLRSSQKSMSCRPRRPVPVVLPDQDGNPGSPAPTAAWTPMFNASRTGSPFLSWRPRTRPIPSRSSSAAPRETPPQ